MTDPVEFMNIETRVSGLYSNKFTNIKSEVIFSNHTLDDLTVDVNYELDSFHPTNVYMVEKQDDYYCGIRANHFIVEEGWSESGDGVYYLVSANHKGMRAMTLIMMYI